MGFVIFRRWVMRGSAGGRSAARGVADTGVDARSREVALAAMTAQGGRKAAALEQKEATRWPPLPARRVESVRLMFWSSTRLRRPCAPRRLVLLFGRFGTAFGRSRGKVSAGFSRSLAESLNDFSNRFSFATEVSRQA